MRKAIAVIEKPYLSLRVEADYLTAGEIGNLLIRLQAVLRILADLSRSRREQPRFIVKSIKGRRRLEILVWLSILSLTAAIPQNLTFYEAVAGKAFVRLKLATVAMAENRGLKAKVSQGEMDIKRAQELLAGLSPSQRKKLADFVSALVKPANRIIIRDEESAVALRWAEPPRLI